MPAQAYAYRSWWAKTLLHAFFIVLMLLYILPLMLIVSVSLTPEKDVLTGGYGLIPTRLTLSAYRALFSMPGKIGSAYLVTLAESVLRTGGALLVQGMAAYPLARPQFRYKRLFMRFYLLTMLFGPSVFASYIVNCNVYHLNNSFAIYVVPALAATGNVMVLRVFFKSLPESLFDAAKIDGASELRTFATIAVPLSAAAFATYGFFIFIANWNDYMTSMIYIRNTSLYTIQYYLKRILNEEEMLRSLSEKGVMGELGRTAREAAPTETLKYAIVVSAMVPVLGIFPFFQKYMTKGIMVGSFR